jgi:hypothetical protein
VLCEPRLLGPRLIEFGGGLRSRLEILISSHGLDETIPGSEMAGRPAAMAILILGPIVGYVGTTKATVWVETDSRCEVEVLGHRAATFRSAAATMRCCR